MPYTVTGNGPSECHFPRNQEAIGKCGHSVHLRRTTVHLAPCLFVFSHPTPQQTERAWNSELMRVLEPALEPSFPDPPPLPPLTCFVEVLGSLSAGPVQNMCRCPPLLRPFSWGSDCSWWGFPLSALIPDRQSSLLSISSSRVSP